MHARIEAYACTWYIEDIPYIHTHMCKHITLILCLYTYVCIYICTHVSVHTCIHTHIHMYLCMYVCMYTVPAFINMHAFVHICVRVHRVYAVIVLGHCFCFTLCVYPSICLSVCVSRASFSPCRLSLLARIWSKPLRHFQKAWLPRLQQRAAILTKMRTSQARLRKTVATEFFGEFCSSTEAS